MSHNYPESPVQEVVFGLPFSSEMPWYPTLPGLFYNEIRGEYPLKDKKIVEEYIQESGGQDRNVQPKIKSTEFSVFWTDDRSSYIQLSSNFIALVIYAPYPGWDVVREKIKKMISSYNRIHQISQVERIGLRYLDRLPLPEGIDVISDYFRFRPEIGEGFEESPISFQIECDFPFYDDRDICRINLKPEKIDSEENENNIILKIDYFLSPDGTIFPDELIEWLDHSHEKIHRVFDSCISPKMDEYLREKNGK